MPENLGDEFHRDTKYDRVKITRVTLDLSQLPPAYKNYDKAPKIVMPSPETTDGQGLELGIYQVAAFFDEEVNQMLHLDGETEGVLYLSVVGKRK